MGDIPSGMPIPTLPKPQYWGDLVTDAFVLGLGICIDFLSSFLNNHLKYLFVREREKEREKQREKENERQREKERERGRESKKEEERGKEEERERERERKREIEKEREREREINRDLYISSKEACCTITIYKTSILGYL